MEPVSIIVLIDLLSTPTYILHIILNAIDPCLSADRTFYYTKT